MQLDHFQYILNFYSQVYCNSLCETARAHHEPDSNNRSNRFPPHRELFLHMDLMNDAAFILFSESLKFSLPWFSLCISITPVPICELTLTQMVGYRVFWNKKQDHLTVVCKTPHCKERLNTGNTRKTLFPKYVSLFLPVTEQSSWMNHLVELGPVRQKPN